MSISAGDSGCTTGLSGSIYAALTGDTTRNGFQGNSIPVDWHDMVRAQCYAIAAQVAAAHNADAYTPKEQWTTAGPADQAFTVGSPGTSGWVDVTNQSFAVAANDEIDFEFVVTYRVDGGNPMWVDFQLVGPASPTWLYFEGVTAFSTVVAGAAPPVSGAVLTARLRGVLRNGANAGTVKIQARGQNPGGGASDTIRIKAGAFCRWAKVN